MVITGEFISNLFRSHNLPQRCIMESSNTSSSFSQPRYFCPDFTQMDFFRLILGIFNGIPETYQLLRCQAITTIQELNLFLERVKRHCSHYLLLDVNKLPYKLQEVGFCVALLWPNNMMLNLFLELGASSFSNAKKPGDVLSTCAQYYSFCWNSSFYAPRHTMDTTKRF